MNIIRTTLYPELKPRNDHSGKKQYNITFVKPHRQEVRQTLSGIQSFWFYEVRCNCGKTKIMMYHASLQSCGCLQRNRGKDKKQRAERDNYRGDFDRTTHCRRELFECSHYNECQDDRIITENIYSKKYLEKKGACYEPPEIEVNIYGENGMATRKLGTCDICGKKDVMAVQNRGKRCCAQCNSVRSTATLRPEVLLSQLAEFGVKAPRAIQDTSKLEIFKLKAMNTQLKNELDLIANKSSVEIEKLTTEVYGLVQANERLIKENLVLIDKKDELLDEVMSMGDRLKSDTGKDSTLLDLALDSMAGKITGLDHFKIAALRAA
jgi:hypothetical protein